MKYKSKQIDLNDKIHWVYLLPFKDGEYFKFGVTSRDIIRLLSLNRSYDIDFKKAIFFRFDEYNKIIVLERFMSKLVSQKKDCPYREKYNSVEIREIRHFDLFKKEAEYFSKKLNGDQFYFRNIKKRFDEAMVVSKRQLKRYGSTTPH